MSWYVNVALYLWDLFSDWIKTIFVIPIQNVDMLWLLVPVWMAWFFAEFFQEKKGTSMGNAITNSVVILWGSIDCVRQTLKLISEGVLANTLDIGMRFGLVLLIFIYGGLIITLGWKGNPIIKYIGRVREVTYVFVMFVPIFYNAIPFSFGHILGAILFFPLFYYAIEMLDRYIPNPKAIVEDLQNNSPRKNSDNLYSSADAFSPDSAVPEQRISAAEATNLNQQAEMRWSR